MFSPPVTTKNGKPMKQKGDLWEGPYVTESKGRNEPRE